jgi:hypothetical protein
MDNEGAEKKPRAAGASGKMMPVEYLANDRALSVLWEFEWPSQTA